MAYFDSQNDESEYKSTFSMEVMATTTSSNIPLPRSRKRKAAAPKQPKFVKCAGQRYGKWTEMEENFANQLVIDFERGFLDDCERGVTLRSYLARSLNCDPMRISKKFAGRCIGKLTYEDCSASMYSEKMKSPRLHLRALYFEEKTAQELEAYEKANREENDSSDYAISYTDNEEDDGNSDVSGSDRQHHPSSNYYHEDDNNNKNDNMKDGRDDDSKNNKLYKVQHGSVLDLIDFVSGTESNIAGMYAFNSNIDIIESIDDVADEWQQWQRYGIPGLLKAESIAINCGDPSARAIQQESSISPTSITESHNEISPPIYTMQEP